MSKVSYLNYGFNGEVIVITAVMFESRAPNKLYSPHVRVLTVICTKRNNNHHHHHYNHNNAPKGPSDLELKKRFIEIGLFINVLCDLILFHAVV